MSELDRNLAVNICENVTVQDYLSPPLENECWERDLENREGLDGPGDYAT